MAEGREQPVGRRPRELGTARELRDGKPLVAGTRDETQQARCACDGLSSGNRAVGHLSIIWTTAVHRST